MKILHTADWHLGKVLHKQELKEDFDLFFDWLIQLIRKEAIDVLLISGDIFDIANPSIQVRRRYYDCLKAFTKLDLEVVITGGNHDSVGMLEAPKDLLEMMNIRVIGGAKETIEDELIKIDKASTKESIIIAAVPFLRDRDVRKQGRSEDQNDRTKALQAGIENHYAELAAIAKEKYPLIPAIAMGHLYARGSQISESEREIHLGNAAMIESKIFDPYFDYVALGHIHKPQIIGKDERVRYSGSPIPLSFSEREDKKTVIVIDVQGKKDIAIQSHLIPCQRKLKKIKGTFQEVSQALLAIKKDTALVPFIELLIQEAQYRADLIPEVNELLSKVNQEDNYLVLKHKIEFLDTIDDTAKLFTIGSQIEDLDPSDVFEKRLEGQDISDDKKDRLRQAFASIIDEIHQIERK